MTDIIIKKGISDDIYDIIDFGKKLHLVEKDLEPLLEFNEKNALARYKDELKSPRALILLAKDKNNRSVGYLYAHNENVEYFTNETPECEIEVVYVKPDCRGQGVASMLIRKCVDWCTTQGVARIKTGIYFSNEPSRKLFEKNNFKPYHISYLLNQEQGEN